MWDTLEELVATSDLVNIMHGGKAFNAVSEVLNESQIVSDLVGVADNVPDSRAAYEGIGRQPASMECAWG